MLHTLYVRLPGFVVFAWLPCLFRGAAIPLRFDPQLLSLLPLLPQSHASALNSTATEKTVVASKWTKVNTMKYDGYLVRGYHLLQVLDFSLKPSGFSIRTLAMASDCGLKLLKICFEGLQLRFICIGFLHLGIFAGH